MASSASQSPPSEKISSQGHIICVVGGKEGVGGSTLAVNMAMALAMDQRQSVGLVDMDGKSTGDIHLVLGVNRVKGFGEDILDGKIRDAVQLKKLTTNFQPTNQSGIVHALQIFSAQDRIFREDLGRLDLAIKLMRRSFGVTVIDCGSRIEGGVIAALNIASLILVVTNPDILTVNHTRRVVEQLQMKMFPPQMTKIVMNKAQGNTYNAKFIEQMFKRELVAMIPEDSPLSNGALTKGQPLVTIAPDSLVAQEMFALSRSVGNPRVLAALHQMGQSSQAHRASIVDFPKGGEPVSKKMKGQLNPRSALKIRVQSLLIEKLDLKKEQLDRALSVDRKAEIRLKASKIVSDILNQEDHPWKSREESARLCEEILNEALGLGPLEDLLADDAVTEIMVNRSDKIYVERSGKSSLSLITFSSNAQLLAVIERIVNPLGRRIDEKTPYVDARLADGSRVHAIIPPLAIDGPMLTIRKFGKKRLGVDDLIKFGSVTPEIGDFLKACIEARLNVLVSGGTGSGKTTLLNVLSNFIPSHERILTVEDSAELQLGQEHVGRLETRPANIEGTGEVSIRDLVKQTLRMRPDRIIVGEVRSGEALDMLQAMNTGHDGSMATIHANTPKDCLSRLETLVLMAGMDLPIKAVREQIASAVHLIVQQSRLADGSRRVTYVTEVIGLQGDRIEIRDIFVYRQLGRDADGKAIGRHTATGFIPHFMERIEALGIKFPPGLFKAA